jgi:hypothetical protein
MIGARLLEHLVEQVGAFGRLPRVSVLGGGDKVRVGGVAFRLRLLLALLPRATLSGRLRDVFWLAPLRLLVLPEDGLDCLLESCLEGVNRQVKTFSTKTRSKLGKTELISKFTQFTLEMRCSK